MQPSAVYRSWTIFQDLQTDFAVPLILLLFYFFLLHRKSKNFCKIISFSRGFKLRKTGVMIDCNFIDAEFSNQTNLVT